MAKLTRRSLRARWIRFTLCSLAVVLGVAFVTGSFVLSDSLRKVFDRLATTFTEDTDVTVRSVDAFGSADALEAAREPVPQALIAHVAAVDGVQDAEGSVSGDVTAIAPDGELFETGGAPVLAISWDGDEEHSPLQLIAGTAPTGRQVALDEAAADTYDVEIGDAVTVRAGTSDAYTVSGIAQIPDGGAGAYYLLFDLPTTQAMFGLDGFVQSIEVRAADGVSEAQLRDRVAAVLPDAYEAITAQQSAEEFSASFDQIIGIFRTVLLVFAFVTLFVAAFLINTVFNTTVGQRVRELGLLRAIGARNSQVRRSVLFESFTIGVLGSVAGALLGILVAAGLKAIFSRGGGGLPDGPLVLSMTTWIVALVVGVGITMLVSLIPAWRAGRVPPVAAMRDGFSPFTGRPIVRTVISGLTLGIGALAFLGGLFSGTDNTAQRLSSLGAGALLIFLGVTGLSPLFARPVANVLGAPFAMLFGVTGRLAQGNAARDPRRTASTAAALMIGVALVSTVGVIGSSFKASFSTTLEQGIAADYFFSSQTFTGFSPAFSQQVEAVPGIDAVTTFRAGQIRVGGENRSVLGVQPQGLDQVLRFSDVEGSLSDIADDAVLVGQQPAEDLGLSVGSDVTALFPVGGGRTLEVAAIYDDPIGVGNWIINQDLFAEGFPPDRQLDSFGGVTLAPDADRAAVAAALDGIAASYPEVALEDRAEFKATQEDQIDQLSNVINGLLGMSLVVAVLGIAITLSLAVFERTRELGLLRAIGQQRRQTRRMVRFEAVVVAVLGAGLGIVLGIVFGVAITSAMPPDVINAIRLPWAQLLWTLVIAAVAGVAAATFPALRASRLNVLDAISYE